MTLDQTTETTSLSMSSTSSHLRGLAAWHRKSAFGAAARCFLSSCPHAFNPSPHVSPEEHKVNPSVFILQPKPAMILPPGPIKTNAEVDSAIDVVRQQWKEEEQRREAGGENTSQPVQHPTYYTNLPHMPPLISMAEKYCEDFQARQRSAAPAPPRQPKPAKKATKSAERPRSKWHHSMPSSQLPQFAFPPSNFCPSKEASGRTLRPTKKGCRPTTKLHLHVQCRTKSCVTEESTKSSGFERNPESRIASQTSPSGVQGLAGRHRPLFFTTHRPTSHRRSILHHNFTSPSHASQDRSYHRGRQPKGPHRSFGLQDLVPQTEGRKLRCQGIWRRE